MARGMNGRVVGMAIVISALAAGAAIYYLQVYGFYREVAATGEADVQLVNLATGEPEPILYSDFRAIDADSSPIRFRACFDVQNSHAMLTETYQIIENSLPRNAPGWFDCFDSEAIAGYLDDGSALLFMGQKNVHYGVDRLVAIHEDGRGWAWNELNACGKKAYDGTVIGEACPPRPDPAE